MTSGRFTPAAATFTRISPSPGVGTGRGCGVSTSGPPGDEITMAVILAGIEVMVLFRLHAAWKPGVLAHAPEKLQTFRRRACAGSPVLPKSCRRFAGAPESDVSRQM